jgi:hypothetical protein
MTASWMSLGSPVLTPEVQKKLVDSVDAEVGPRTIAEPTRVSRTECQ